MPTPGIFEILIVLGIVLLIFGPKRLPDLGRSLGSGMREFKDSVTSRGDDGKLPAGEDEKAEPVRAEKSEATPAGGHGS